MRAILLRVLVASALAVSTLAVAPAARANDMDPVLSRMWLVQGGRIVARDDLFDGLALELAMAMAPGIHAPAETLGWSGFFMGLEATLTVVDSAALHLVCGVENPGPGGDGGNGECNSWEDNADAVRFVPAIHVRKGLPYSLELGFQVQYMANTELVGIGGELRWAPFEGFRTGWMGFLPDLSVRFSGNYLMGSNEIALGQLGGDVSLSYPFTVSGEMTLTPYAGYQFMVIGADHEQVMNSYYVENGPAAFAEWAADQGLTDPSPYIDFHDGLSRNFGQQLATLKYHRLFFGVRFLWERLAVTPQITIAMPWEIGEAEDPGVRFQVGLSVGSDF